MAKKKTTALTAKKQLLAESVLTQSGKVRAASTLSKAAIAERKGTTAPATSTTTAPTDAVDSGISTSAEAQSELDVKAAELEVATKSQIEGLQTESALELAIASRREALGTEEDTTLTGIKESFAGRAAAQEQRGRELVGGTRAFLGRAGAFSSASGRGAIQRQVESNEAQLNELKALEQASLNEARKAYASQDFELLNKQLAAADSRRAEINQLQQQQLQNFVSLTNLEISQTEAKQQQVQFTLDALSKIDADVLSKTDLSGYASIEAAAGLPSGYFSNFAESLVEAKKAQASEDVFEREEALTELALQVPEGSTIQVGDYTVEGMKAVTPNKKYWSFEDNAGNVTLVALDEKTGEIKTEKISGISKATRTGAGAPSENSFANIASSLADEFFRFETQGDDVAYQAYAEARANIIGEFSSNPETLNLILGEADRLVQDQLISQAQIAQADQDALYGTTSVDLMPDILETALQGQYLFTLTPEQLRGEETAEEKAASLFTINSGGR
mgnify:CR=1 FL=1